MVSALRVSGVTAVLFISLMGCKKPASDAAPPMAPAPVAQASASAPPAATVAPAGKMAHCPSTVTGSSTTVEDVAGGVALTVTSADAAATSEIRARAAFLGTASKNDTAPVTHNGTGEGGGIYGRCPIVMRNTTVTVSDVLGGSKLVVTPRDTREQDWLRRESRSRLAEVAAPGAAGAGVGKMAHCPNAVKGATTAVTEGKGAVSVAVTAKDDGAVKEIRDRAKQLLVAAQRSDKAIIKHDGSGDGGGGFGRCPIVLKDTSIDEKDTPGGALFTLTPKNAKNLPELTQQVHDRSAKFE